MRTMRLLSDPRLLVLTVLISVVRITSAKVRLVDNGYEGVIVAINPDIKENKYMLQRLENFLTATSAALFKATRNQLFFREFHIVIPEEWESKQTYENALDVELDRAQFIIDRSNPAYGHAPYVKQYAECGSPGLYIHLTPGYLLDDAVVRKWGRPEKTLVHEWAHLRWGLFDEYPIDAQDDAFYRYAGVWQPTRCSMEVEGSILNEYTNRPCYFDFITGKPERNCRFFPRMAANKAASSIMFMQYLESITEFCDDPATAPKHLKHNYMAPNRQNRLCHYKSAWQVMRKHADFAKKKKPLPDNTDTKPRFRYVQAHPRKRVLVLDTSGSMTGASLNVLKQAASNYILSCIETGSKLGIVQFNTNASALSQLVEVNNEKDRFSLIDALPRQAMGKTSIGSGLAKAVEVLTKTGDAPGGSIVLITDGKENEGPYLKDLRPALMKQGIVVHALAYGQRAEQSIAELSHETGGKTFFYSRRANSTALIDGLAATVATENSVISRAGVPHSILTDAGMVTKLAPLHGEFYIDSTVGRDTSLTFSFSNHIEVKVQGPTPSFEVFTMEEHKSMFRYNTVSNMLKVIIPEIATVHYSKINKFASGQSNLQLTLAGKWTYHVTTNSTKSHITLNIQSKPSKKGGDVLQVNSWIPDQGEIWFNPKQKFGIYAEVVMGKAPVLGAQVIATIERPQSVPVDLQLFDNGVGFDIIKGDGVYAASILSKDLMGNGRYNIKVHATAVDNGTRVITSSTGPASRALDVLESGQLKTVSTRSLEKFQRVASAGEFRLRGFPPATATAAKITNKNNASQPEIDVDEMPPSRITDLHVTSFDLDNFTASLVWTAVGDDMERGTASMYNIIISDDFAKLVLDEADEAAGDKTAEQDLYTIPQENVIMGIIDAPRKAGQTENFELWLNPKEISITSGLLGDSNFTIFLGVQAVDSAGNAGTMSNIVSLSKAAEIAVPRVPLTKATISLETYLAFLLPAAFILLVLLLISVALFVHRARKIKSKDIDSKNDWRVNMAHMNYMFEGEYRKRSMEELDNWSKGST